MCLIFDQRKKRNCFPKEVEKPVGKTMLLKLKLNSYNQGHPSSGVSVSQYIECEENADEDETNVSPSLFNISHKYNVISLLVFDYLEIIDNCRFL